MTKKFSNNNGLRGLTKMASNVEMNLTRLSKTTLPQEFVREHNGEWNHRDWLEFCAYLEEKGYTPIDLDQVGLLLEKSKADFFAGND